MIGKCFNNITNASDTYSVLEKKELKETFPYIISVRVKLNLWLHINYIVLWDSIETVK